MLNYLKAWVKYFRDLREYKRRKKAEYDALPKNPWTGKPVTYVTSRRTNAATYIQAEPRDDNED